MTARELRIREIIEGSLHPTLLEIENESHMHSGPGSETHFKVLVVAPAFEGKSRIDRQRMVNDLLKNEMQTGLHALTQRALTPQEFENQKDALNFISPECRGGSKR
ncbi:BolA family transcriptional regulator [Bdellovibrio sp. NC01]|uniref:BolA family protein n=1 Tax=Bdellovibrio sp. NC01 TaxID=2220073 RepID=UPI001158E4BA|nr:BolA family protein [Bdellovibrio sp. NC01]QDK37179.1 BolA family transcriptional regulator [Bdellovibrio sp. NC01]